MTSVIGGLRSPCWLSRPLRLPEDRSKTTASYTATKDINREFAPVQR